ncbi:MAG TPA: hypothetical protein PL031_05560 [Neisseria sp.]|nr:hypothetical protein [Neisseria sp.]
MNPKNPLNLPAELPIARYRFGFALESEMRLPEYAGSTLRGVFGHALRRLACMTRRAGKNTRCRDLQLDRPEGLDPAKRMQRLPAAAKLPLQPHFRHPAQPRTRQKQKPKSAAALHYRSP